MVFGVGMGLSQGMAPSNQCRVRRWCMVQITWWRVKTHKVEVAEYQHFYYVGVHCNRAKQLRSGGARGNTLGVPMLK